MAFCKISCLLLVSPLVSGILNVLVIWLLRAKEELLCVELLYYEHGQFHGAVAATRALGLGPAPSGLGGGLAIDCSKGWIGPQMRLLERRAGTASACCTLTAFIWKHGKQGPKVFLHPACVRAAVLTLSSTADFIHSWHSNTVKMSVVKMPSYVLFMPSVVCTVAFWSCDLKKPNCPTQPNQQIGNLLQSGQKCPPYIFLLCSAVQPIGVMTVSIAEDKRKLLKNLNTCTVLFITAFIFSEWN